MLEKFAKGSQFVELGKEVGWSRLCNTKVHQDLLCIIITPNTDNPMMYISPDDFTTDSSIFSSTTQSGQDTMM